MGRKIESPVEKFAGHVVIADPMTMPQVLAFEDALIKAGAFYEEENGMRILKRDAMWGAPDSVYMSGVFPCVEEWKLKNVPENPDKDNFYFSPRPASHTLVQWLVNEILKVYWGEVEVPNE